MTSDTITYLIIGGGVAGTTAAETLRKKDPTGSIAIVSDEPYRLYSRIMLSKPNFFLGKIAFDQVWLKKESWYEENAVKLIASRRAVELDPARKTVKLDDGTSLKYEKLLLAIGGVARKLALPGSDLGGVFVLRSLDDAKGIIERTRAIKRAASIGGGFVSFEMRDMLRLANVDVTLIIREPYYWQNLLDETSGLMIEEALEKGGVRIIKNAQVERIEGAGTVESIVLKDGMRVPAEMIIAGIGLFCPLDWLKSAGVSVGRGIVTNEYFETNIPSVWAAGDAAEFNDLILGETIQLGNWVNAQMQGRVAALNMAGSREPFRLVSFYTTQGFGITIGFVGDVRPESDRLIIPRGSKEMNSYARIIVKDGEVIGATFINKAAELGAVSKIIERDIKVEGKEKELGDPSFNLASLVQ